ncbi:hypothetical protein [Algiphilus aromaticivorans]|uniref:hypothetical protein n=1 Tax=Algiphilus aromaticivorans TaxID=382454 RepID=UPI0012ECAA7F|nr:hypothetical protein [Algiphilus aromaticivorans]
MPENDATTPRARVELRLRHLAYRRWVETIVASGIGSNETRRAARRLKAVRGMTPAATAAIRRPVAAR